MNILNIKQKITELCKPNSKPHIILGLSGGPDSVFLFHILNEMYKEELVTLTCCHLNHGWRKESGKDEQFVKELCESNGLKIIIKHASKLVQDKYNGSKEDLGRRLRQKFFLDLLNSQNANYVALAHHLDDQEETFLIRIIRGTTVNGLTCIKEKEGIYIRPLLNITKQEIFKFLEDNSLNYIQDQTNFSNDFLRNRIRKFVIPALKQCDNRFDKKFTDTLKNLQDEDNFLSILTKTAYAEIFNANNIGSLKKFFKIHPVLQKRILISWLIKEKAKFTPSLSYLNELLKFLSSPKGGSHYLCPEWKIIKRQDQFYLEKISSPLPPLQLQPLD